MHRLRIARDVHDAVECGDKLSHLGTEARSGRVDEHSAQLKSRNIDVRHPLEAPCALQGLPQLFCGHPRQRDVRDAVVRGVSYGSIHQTLDQLSRQHLPEAGRKANSKVAIAAVELQQVVASGRPCRADRPIVRASDGPGPAEHVLGDLAIGLREAALDLAVAQRLRHASHSEALLDPRAPDDRAPSTAVPHHAGAAQCRAQALCGTRPSLRERAIINGSRRCGLLVLLPLLLLIHLPLNCISTSLLTTFCHHSSID
mmetsp:Transcript_49183/g.124827  ORF Transcript_49183/g.124827 Transcript_49183/m.124827 type:complete len:257 (-) Transcript_49183:759-1529(-)